MRFIVKSVDIPDRIVVSYVEQGDPSGVPMLLLHGFTDSWHSFERVLPHLSQTVHAFAVWGAFAYYWPVGDATVAGTLNLVGADRPSLMDEVIRALKQVRPAL